MSTQKKEKPLPIFDELAEPYRPLIRRIRNRRRTVAVLFVAAYVLLVFFGVPFRIDIPGDLVIVNEGLATPSFVILLLLIGFLWLCAYVVVMNPVYQALGVGCDPQKSLVLHAALVRTEPQRAFAFADGLFFLGRYREALAASGALPANTAKRAAASVEYNRVRCAFMLGDMEMLATAVAALSAACSASLSKGGKRAARCRIMLDEAALMSALADPAFPDAQICELAEALPKRDSLMINVGFFCFLRGLAAYRLGNTEDKIYYLRHTREVMPNTAMAAEAARYLSMPVGESGEDCRP